MKKTSKMLFVALSILCINACGSELENDDLETYSEEIAHTRTVGCDIYYDEANCIINIACEGQGQVVFHDGSGGGPNDGSPLVMNAPFTTAPFGWPVKEGVQFCVAPNGIGGLDDRCFQCTN